MPWLSSRVNKELIHKLILSGYKVIVARAVLDQVKISRNA